MAEPMNKVKPGDLITSDLLNAIVGNLEELMKGVSTGTGLVTVPSVIGRRFSEARATAQSPATHMGLGAVFDVTGQAVDTTSAEVQTRIVVNQDPPPGARVPAGTPLKMVLSARAATGGGTTPTKPTIVSFTPEKTRIGDPVTIRGTNFELAREDNEVFFAGKKAQVPLASNREELVVVVPDIDQPPTGTQEKQVEVLVKTVNGTAESKTTLLAKSEVPSPAITSTSPTRVTPNDDLTIRGTAFASTPQGNTVIIDTQTGTIKGGSAGTLIVGVPQSLFAGMGSGTTKQVDVRVTNKETGKTSPPGTKITLAVPEPA